MKRKAFVFTHPNSENLITFTENQDEALNSFSAELGHKSKVAIHQWVGKVTVTENKVFESMAVEHSELSDYKEVTPNTCPTCGLTAKAA